MRLRERERSAMADIVLALPVISSTLIFSITHEGIRKRRGDMGEAAPYNRECSAPYCSSSSTSHPPSREERMQDGGSGGISKAVQ
jgi:hypothetical protein